MTSAYSIAIDMTGKSFGRLTVKEKSPTVNSRAMWLCVCECGNEKIVMGKYLRNGDVKSCGCLKPDVTAERNYKHGLCKHPLYKTWAGMIQRCINKNQPDYQSYGGKGVTVVPEWRDFKTFYAWALPQWIEGLSIDRIDFNGNYEPDNCRFTNQTVQCINQGIRKDSTTGIRGVVWDKQRSKWFSHISISGNFLKLGYFDTIFSAAASRISAENKHYVPLVGEIR